jgi:hypothetical protein
MPPSKLLPGTHRHRTCIDDVPGTVPPAWLERRPGFNLRNVCVRTPANCLTITQAHECYQRTAALWRPPVFSHDLLARVQRKFSHLVPAPQVSGADGEDQVVAIVDAGAADFLFFNFMPGGRSKLVAEYDMRCERLSAAPSANGRHHPHSGGAHGGRSMDAENSSESVASLLVPVGPRDAAVRNHAYRSNKESGPPLQTLGGPCTFASDFNNHVVKTAIMAYWTSMPGERASMNAAGEHTHSDASDQAARSASSPAASSMEGERELNMTAAGVSLVSLKFASDLCLTRRKDQGGGVREREPYLAGLVRSLRWVVAHHRRVNVTAVQISAYDGLYEDGPHEWAAQQPELYAAFTAAASALRRDGVWVSAPTGNNAEDVQETPIDRISWPASDPNVFAIGCASETSGVVANWTRELGAYFSTRLDAARGYPITPEGETHRSLAKGENGVLLLPSPMPWSSTCNAIACAVSVALRSILATRCKLNPLDVAPEAIFRLMTQTSVPSWDPATVGWVPVVHPRALYQEALRASCRSVRVPDVE